MNSNATSVRATLLYIRIIFRDSRAAMTCSFMHMKFRAYHCAGHSAQAGILKRRHAIIRHKMEHKTAYQRQAYEHHETWKTNNKNSKAHRGIAPSRSSRISSLVIPHGAAAAAPTPTSRIRQELSNSRHQSPRPHAQWRPRQEADSVPSAAAACTARICRRAE